MIYIKKLNIVIVNDCLCENKWFAGAQPLRCEVSGEAPLFVTDTKWTDITVIGGETFLLYNNNNKLYFVKLVYIDNTMILILN